MADRAQLEIIVVEESRPGRGGGGSTPRPGQPPVPVPNQPSDSPGAISSLLTGFGAAQGSRIAGGLASGTGSATAAGLASAGATTGLSSLAVAAGPAVIGLGLVAGGAFAVKEGFQALTRTISGLEQSLLPFSGSVAGGAAQADIFRLEARIRQAEQIGGNVGEFLRERGELDAVLRDIQTNLLRPLLPLITDGVEVLTAILRIIKLLTDNFPDISITSFIDTIIGWDEKLVEMFPILKSYFELDIKIAKEIKKLLTGDQDFKDLEMTKEMLHFLNPTNFFGGGKEFDISPTTPAGSVTGGRGPLR